MKVVGEGTLKRSVKAASVVLLAAIIVLTIVIVL
jgi:hypothetical protein